MRIILFCFFILPILGISQQAAGDLLIRKSTTKDIISCPHSGHTVANHSYTPIPISNKKTNSKPVEFIAEFINVPSTFRRTVDFTLDRLSNFVSTDVPVYVSVEYIDLGGGSGGGLTLANARTIDFVSNFPGAEYINTFYPMALAEKLSGQEINAPGEPDILIQVNSNTNANFSVSPNNPLIGTKSDLATVLIHEIIHGLGYSAAGNVDSEGRGALSPSIFTRYLEDRDGVNYLNGYDNNSEDLGDELTGNFVFFNGPRFDFETRPNIHSPSMFNGGSSLSHLSAAVYRGTDDRLMAPFINGGDINYDPGISIDMLHDLGWFTTNFVHDNQRFNEDASQDYDISAKVRTDSDFDRSSVKLYYSRDTFQNEVIEVDLPQDANTEEYLFTLAATNTFTVFQYYFEVTDTSGQVITTPIRAPDTYFQYFMGADTEGPELIGHIPVTSIKETDVEFTLSVNRFEDVFTGVDTSSLAVVVNLNNQLDTIPFELKSDGFGEFYEVTINGEYSSTDQLGYKIILLDKSINKNEGQLPEEGGFYTIDIEEVSGAVVSYINNFDATSNDFQGTGFSIIQPNGFDDPAIHSEHPYQTAGMGTLDFTYELSQLIRIDSINPVIEFDEIVIVETGDAGTVCRGIVCTFEFWDYVVVEGKRPGETRWQPFLDAYDSRRRAVWRRAYDAGESGTPDLYRASTIDMTENGNFNIGDEVFIRFRLFSDPAANGWGWAIDNLEIQPDIDTPTLDEEILESFSVFPNPSKSDQPISIDISFQTDFSGELSLLNPVGQTIWKEYLNNTANHRSFLDASNLPSGTYFVRLMNNQGVSTRKIIVD